MQFVKVGIEPVIVGNQMLNILYSIILASIFRLNLVHYM